MPDSSSFPYPYIHKYIHYRGHQQRFSYLLLYSKLKDWKGKEIYLSTLACSSALLRWGGRGCWGWTGLWGPTWHPKPSPSEFCRDAAPLMRKACRARLRSPKLQLLGTLLGLSSMLWSALGDLRMPWACGEPFPLVPAPRGLEKTRSFKLTFWLFRETRWNKDKKETAGGVILETTQSFPTSH